MNGQFDFQLGLGHLLAWLTALMVVAWPVSSAVQQRRPLEVMRALILLATGTLLLMRAQAAFTSAADTLAADLHPELVTAVLTLIVMSAWAGTWLAVLPAIGDAVAEARNAIQALVLATVGMALVYVVVAVVAPLPGKFAAAGRDAESATRQAANDRQTQARGQLNAGVLVLCSQLAEIDRFWALKPAGRYRQSQIDRLASWTRSWGLQRDSVQACVESAPKQPERLVALEADLNARLIPWVTSLRPSAVAWPVSGPVTGSDGFGMRDMQLTAYFGMAFGDPWAHLKKVVNELDLATSMVLLGELMAALAWLADLLARRLRNADGSTTDESGGHNAPDASDKLFGGEA